MPCLADLGDQLTCDQVTRDNKEDINTYVAAPDPRNMSVVKHHKRIAIARKPWISGRKRRTEP